MKKNIFLIFIAFFTAIIVVFTSCQKESTSPAPVVNFGDISGLGAKSTDGDTIKFTLGPGVKKGVVSFEYSIVADGVIKSVYLMRSNISKRVEAAEGQKSYSSAVQDTLSPNIYTCRVEVKDNDGNISSQTVYVRIIGVLIYRKPIYDPATFSGTYPPNMEVVAIGTTKFLRVVFNGWENKFWFPEVDTFNIDKVSWTGWKCKVRYALGQNSMDNGWEMTNIDNYVRVNDDLTPGAEWSEVLQWSGLYDTPTVPYFPEVNGTFQEISGSLLDGNMNTINYMNFYAVQQIPWGPVTGDTLWVSKVVSYDPLDVK